uniref:Collagen type IV alpha-3-binding protein n=1 Tax=Lygus hesperus TaxID=30085 RepID=A0A0A9W4M0_LYGHE
MKNEHVAVLGGNHDDAVAEFQGTLSKWTNYILGWQSRFFVLKNGHLMYYKSVEDVRLGCRGAINLVNVNLEPHKLDECRFDLHFCDLFWCLRADSSDERQKWIDVLSSYTAAPSSTGPPDFTRCDKRWTIREKTDEIGAFKELILSQMKRLVDYFNDQNNVLETSRISEVTLMSFPKVRI